MTPGLPEWGGDGGTARGRTCLYPTSLALPSALPFLPRLQLSHLSLCLQLIDRATSPRDEDDAKRDSTCLEDSWQELGLLKATPRLQPQPRPAALSQPVPPPAPSPSAPGEWHPFLSDLGGSPFGGHVQETQPGPAPD